MDDLEPTNSMLEVTDLKQYRYCPRVVYYRYHLPRLRPTTYKMEEGILGHQEEAHRETRRQMQLYDLPPGEKLLDLRLNDPTIGLHGKLDLAIVLPGLANLEEIIPVEYKWSGRTIGPHFRLQLAAYAFLLQKIYGLPVRRGLFYQPLLRRSTQIAITPQLLRQVPLAIKEILAIRQSDSLPTAPRQVLPCLNCEFRRICNDTV